MFILHTLSSLYIYEGGDKENLLNNEASLVDDHFP